MENRREPPARPPGAVPPSEVERITAIELVALILSVIWLVVSASFFLLVVPAAAEPGGVLRFVLVLMVIFLPVAMIWVAAMSIRAARVMRVQSSRLQAAIDAIRQAYIAQSQAQAETARPDLAKKLDEIAAAQRKTEAALTLLASSVATGSASAAAPADPTPEHEGQVALPLGTPAEDLAPPLANADFIRALNFPETAEDKAGFAALRRALKDRSTAQLVQAAQDVLTLLSQEGIYMDDLRPDMARPEIWRRFAAGERGRQIAMLGGVRDRSSLALTAARMRSDPIFRDAAHHFLRKFDRIFAEFAERATDPEISEMADTRTARAFMLLGRVAGTFD